MRTYVLQVVAVLFGLMPLLTASHADDGIRILYQERLDEVLAVYGNSSGQQKPGAAARSLSFDAFGKRFDINLEVNRALLDTAQQAQLDGRYEIYRGDIAGMPNSWVRLVIADGVPRGMLWDGSELLAIEVERDASGIDRAFIYRLSDLQIPPGMLGCSEIGQAKNAGELAKAVLSEVTPRTSQASGATSQIDFSVIGDYEFTSAQLLGAGAAITTRMNNVDGIFSMQLGVQLNVNRIDTFAANDDPFTDETDSSLLLDELTDYRFDTAAQHASGLTHLFTGRDLDTSTVGIAYTGALCSRRFGAGLTQGTHGVTMDSLIAAHEIGHNFGAPHDGTSGSPCESETDEFLMAPRLNGSDEFSACSITQMQDDVNRASCISPMPGTDVAIVSGGQAGTALLGDTVTVTFDANSIGTDDASGVNVDVTIPSGVNLSSVSTSVGSNCTSGASSASCAIGSIAAGSGVTVTITAETTAVGSADFVASVTADTDDNGNNNQATARLTVNTAVDLIAIAAGTAQVALDASATIRPSIENRSPIAATGVTLTVTPNAGITIDSASWPPGSCSITGNVATCQASSVAAQSNPIVQLGITGTSDGSQSYSMAVSAAETDRLPANNNASGQINVGSVVSNPPDDSGGGSIGWLSLLLLALSAMLVWKGRNRDSMSLDINEFNVRR